MKKNKNKKFNKFFITNINKAMEKAGISITDVARRLGINYSSAWRMLHGKRNIKPEYIAEIAYITCKTPNDFFYDNNAN